LSEFCFSGKNSHIVLHRTLTRWIHGKREKLFWGAGGAVALTVILLSCSNLDTNRTILAPPSIPGAEFVGSDACDACHHEIVRDFRTATHARLQRTTREMVNANKSGGKGSEVKGSVTTVQESTDMGCESCHGPGSLHVKAGGGRGTIVNPRRDPQTCFQCHLEVRASFELPHHHPVLEGKMSCVDCHNPHKGRAIKGGGTSMQQTLVGGGIAFLGENETCFQCHTAQRGPFVYEHEALRDGCVSCHSPHGSVNQRMLTQRNQTLCLKCHFEQQTDAGTILIGDVNHSSFLQQGTCWSAGCHGAIHGSQVNEHFRF
jgi:predicted CXXCH cytochrome family protein